MKPGLRYSGLNRANRFAKIQFPLSFFVECQHTDGTNNDSYY